MSDWPLPPELTIYHVAELHRDWLQRLAELDRGDAAAAPAALDASPLQQLDGAGLQLLLSLRKALAERGLEPPLRGAGPALQAAATALGLQARLGLATTGGAAA
jgi:ABC-type transporter Mla MlaB component